jgi:hypothetical protein
VGNQAGAQYSPTLASASGEFRLTAPRLNQTGALTFHFEANSGTYDVEGAESLTGTWRAIKTVTIPAETKGIEIEIDPGLNRFFRLKRRL